MARLYFRNQRREIEHGKSIRVRTEGRTPIASAISYATSARQGKANTVSTFPSHAHTSYHILIYGHATVCSLMAPLELYSISSSRVG